MTTTRALRAAGTPSAVIPGRASFLARARNPYSRMVVMDSGPAPSGASRNDEEESPAMIKEAAALASPLVRQPEGSFHHRHTAAADMAGDDSAVFLADAGQQQARSSEVDALPDRNDSSASRSPARSASSAAAAAVALPVAGSSDRPLDPG
jgi:hypothetical protein